MMWSRVDKRSKNIGMYISLWRRLASILYDSILVCALLILMSAPFYNLNIEDNFYLRITMQIYYYFIIQYFFVWFWVNKQGTLGMKTWKIRVTDLDGKSLSYKKAIIRFNMSIISILIFGLGFLMSIFHKHNKCMHDIISETVLIKN